MCFYTFKWWIRKKKKNFSCQFLAFSLFGNRSGFGSLTGIFGVCSRVNRHTHEKQSIKTTFSEHFSFKPPGDADKLQKYIWRNFTEAFLPGKAKYRSVREQPFLTLKGFNPGKNRFFRSSGCSLGIELQHWESILSDQIDSVFHNTTERW